MTSAYRKKVHIRRIPVNQCSPWEAYTQGSGALTSATRHGGQKGKNLIVNRVSLADDSSLERQPETDSSSVYSRSYLN